MVRAVFRILAVLLVLDLAATVVPVLIRSHDARMTALSLGCVFLGLILTSLVRPVRIIPRYDRPWRPDG